MKAIKISLAIVVVTAIGFYAWYFLGDKIFPPKAIPQQSNTITEQVEREIDSLKNSPSNAFCIKFYENIQYHITDDYNHGDFSEDKQSNELWKDNLSKNLYSAYAPKFAEQALYVFSHSEWKIEDLNFIRSEVKRVQSSNYLEQDSPVDSAFKKIRAILSKYDEVTGFISSCSYVSYSFEDINSRFPISDIKTKIQKKRIYISNHLDNIYVNNCTRLKDGLTEIPQKLFSIHVNYLRSKIHYHSGKSTNYKSHLDYSSSIYKPLQNELKELDNDIYGVDGNIFDSNYNSLEVSLNADDTNAFKYFSTNK